MKLGRLSRRRALVATALLALIAAGVAGAVGMRSAVAPTNNSLPTIGGTAEVGSTVTANPGTWAGSTPISFQYQWRICGADGGACHDIAGATSQTYKFTSADLGNTARVGVLAGNADGSSSATSAATAKIAAASGPTLTAEPTISGDAKVGSTLTATTGTWNGNGTLSFKYQWRVCSPDGSACRDIAGATSQTYVLTKDDLGNALRVVVTATDSTGSTDATSGATASIGAAPAPPTGCPKLAAGATSVSVNDVTSPARLQVQQFRLTTGSPVTLGMTSIGVLFHVSDTCGNPVSGALVYATAVPYKQWSIPAETATDASGNVTLTFNRQIGFPAKSNQQLLVMFVRARKTGDPLLAGISTRRLVSLPVNLKK
jgi:hypothetical protein